MTIHKRLFLFVIQASAKPVLEYHIYRTPYYVEGEHQLSLVQEATVDTKTVSSLEVKKTEDPLVCNGENHITIHYTVVGETAGPLDLMYLVRHAHTVIYYWFQLACHSPLEYSN